MTVERIIKAHLDLEKAKLEAAESWRPVARESAGKRARMAEEELAEARLAEWRAVLGGRA
jgi:hypothetical protein